MRVSNLIFLFVVKRDEGVGVKNSNYFIRSAASKSMRSYFDVLVMFLEVSDFKTEYFMFKGCDFHYVFHKKYLIFSRYM